MLLTNTFEGGSGGVAITVGNSGGASGTAFDQVTVSAGDGAANFDTAHPAHGGLGMLCQTGATTGEAYVMWSAALGGTFATLFDRTYLYLPALPGTQTRLIRWLSVSTVRGSVQISTAGKLLLTDSAGTTVATSATTLPTGSQFRIEAKCTGDAAAGVLEAKIFLTPDATSPNETLTATALNTGGTIDRVRFGQTGTAIANVSFYLDDLGVADGDYLGPASAPSQYQPLSPRWLIQQGLWAPWQGATGVITTLDATVTVPAPADATADTIPPTVSGDATVTAVMATATADTIPPTAAGDATVTAVQAAATADGIVPAATGDAGVTAVQAIATADALVPSVSGAGSPDGTVTVPAPADATASALAPTAIGDATVTAVQVTATADALVPTVAGGATVTVPAPAAATADALPPTVGVAAQVLAVIADATAAALLPTVIASSTISPPMAMATADALVPTVASAGPVVPGHGTATALNTTGTATAGPTGGTTTAGQPSGHAAAGGTSGTVQVLDTEGEVTIG